jgi:outer membrane lipoprotein-sorting protein
MGPDNFEAVAQMTAHRDDGTVRTYKMRLLKAGTEKLRIWFSEPAAVRGQEMLRQGENLWVYLPSLKKPTRLASRESFQGGDFNNADVLRVHYQTDYDAQVLPDSGAPDTWALELKAKTSDAAYERIKLWIRKSDGMPTKGEYYTASGKMLRAADFSDVRSFGGFRRPAKVVMKNMLTPKRWSELVMDTFNTKVNPPAARFVLDDLGR